MVQFYFKVKISHFINFDSDVILSLFQGTSCSVAWPEWTQVWYFDLMPFWRSYSTGSIAFPIFCLGCLIFFFHNSGRYNDFAKQLNANGLKVYGMDWIGELKFRMRNVKITFCLSQNSVFYLCSFFVFHLFFFLLSVTISFDRIIISCKWL